MNKLLIFIILAILLALMFPISCNRATPTTSYNPQQPVEVVSIRQGGTPNPPSGTIVITVKNVGSEPVTHLVTTLKLIYASPPDFEIVFPHINPQNPLLPGKSAEQSQYQFGPNGINRNTPYPLTINATTESGTEFNYIVQVEFK